MKSYSPSFRILKQWYQIQLSPIFFSSINLASFEQYFFAFTHNFVREQKKNNISLWFSLPPTSNVIKTGRAVQKWSTVLKRNWKIFIVKVSFIKILLFLHISSVNLNGNFVDRLKNIALFATKSQKYYRKNRVSCISSICVFL